MNKIIFGDENPDPDYGPTTTLGVVYTHACQKLDYVRGLGKTNPPTPLDKVFAQEKNSHEQYSSEGT